VNCLVFLVSSLVSYGGEWESSDTKSGMRNENTEKASWEKQIFAVHEKNSSIPTYVLV
jgi:hypothetical protein